MWSNIGWGCFHLLACYHSYLHDNVSPNLFYSFYQKVPAELPELEKKQVYGLATPEDFTLPPHHTLWSEEAYAAFHVTPEASEKYDTKVCK